MGLLWHVPVWRRDVMDVGRLLILEGVMSIIHCCCNVRFATKWTNGWVRRLASGQSFHALRAENVAA